MTKQRVIIHWYEGQSEPGIWLKTSGTGHNVVRLENGQEVALDYRDRLEFPDCDCAAWGPVSHLGSPRCRSHSLAAGGHRSHCTCDTCF